MSSLCICESEPSDGLCKVQSKHGGNKASKSQRRVGGGCLLLQISGEHDPFNVLSRSGFVSIFYNKRWRWNMSMLMYPRNDEFQANTRRHLLGNEMEEIKMLTVIISPPSKFIVSVVSRAEIPDRLAFHLLGNSLNCIAIEIHCLNTGCPY